MGAELYVSVNAVKTHTRQLYRKLGYIARGRGRTSARAKRNHLGDCQAHGPNRGIGQAC